MKTFLIILGILAYLGAIGFVLCLGAIAGRADRRIEELHRHDAPKS